MCMEEYNCGAVLKVIWKPTCVKTRYMPRKLIQNTMQKDRNS
jgi:hypothetical protein